MLADLKRQALAAPTKRARINLHEKLSDAVQEMIVAEHHSTYVRPHRHPGKLESFHVLEGLLTVVVFDDTGEIVDTIQMGGPLSGRALLYRQRQSVWHTVLIESTFAVLHEVVDGPFPYATEWALWAPAVTYSPQVIDLYVSDLKARIGL